MKRILFPGLVAGAVLLSLSFLLLYLTVQFFPNIAEQYYHPMFRRAGGRATLFYLHPFVLSFALAWFWDRFKDSFAGGAWLRGLEAGAVYTVVATVPVMWITFSAIDVSARMVLTWLLYGFVQAVAASLVFARMNP